jgi:hypothetical protein
MKIHRVVQMLGATTSSGKLASDMYDLNYKTYYSEGEDKHIPISHMDFQHLIRSFIKLCDQEEMLDRSKHMGRVKDLTAKLEQVESFNEHNHEVYKTNLKEQEEKLQAIIDEKDKLLEKETKDKILWKDMYYNECTTKGHYYTFSEVPQDEEGKEFVKNCRKYLNKESYNIRVKGQHLKKELYGQGRAYHGANMGDCTHMRVYIDNK